MSFVLIMTGATIALIATIIPPVLAVIVGIIPGVLVFFNGYQRSVKKAVDFPDGPSRTIAGLTWGIFYTSFWQLILGVVSALIYVYTVVL